MKGQQARLSMMSFTDWYFVNDISQPVKLIIESRACCPFIAADGFNVNKLAGQAYRVHRPTAYSSWREVSVSVTIAEMIVLARNSTRPRSLWSAAASRFRGKM